MGLSYDEQTNLALPKAVTVESYYADKKASSFNALAYAIPLSAVAAIDTVGQSVGLLDEQTIANSLAQISPTVQQTYKDNRDAYGLVGDVGMTMLGGAIITKALRAGAIVDSGLSMLGTRGATAASYLTTDYKAVEVMKDLYSQRINLQAANGVRDFASLTDVKQLANTARLKQFTNNLKESVATEAFTAVFQKDSKLYFPEGTTNSDIAWNAGIGIGLGVGPGQIVMRSALKRLNARAGTILGEVSPKVSGEAATDLIAGIYGTAQANNVIDTKTIVGDTLGRVQSNRTANEQLIKNSVTQLATNVPITEIHADASKLIDIGKATKALVPFFKSNTRLAANIVAIDVADAGINLGLKIEKAVLGKTDEITKIAKSMESTSDAHNVGKQIRIDQLKAEISDSKDGLTFARLNRFGNIEEVNSKSQLSTADLTGLVTARATAKRGIASDTFVSSAPNSKTLVGIDSFGQMVAGGRNISTTKGMMAADAGKVYASMDKAANNLVAKLAKPGIVLERKAVSPAAAQETLDYILHLADNKSLAMGDLERVFTFDSSLRSVDDIRLAALKTKYVNAVGMFKNKKAAFTITDVAHATNLRVSDDLGQPNAVLSWVNDLHATGGKDAMSEFKTYRQAMTSFQMHYATGATSNTIREAIGKDPSHFHGMLHLDMAANFKDVEPLLVTFRNNHDAGLMPHIAQYNTIARSIKDVQKSSLRSSIAGLREINPIIADLPRTMEELAPLHDMVTAAIHNIDQSTQHAPLVTKVGPVLPRTRNFVNRAVPAFAEAGIIQDTIERGIVQRLNVDMNANLKATFNLRLPQNAEKAQELLNYINARNQGWRLSAEGIADGSLALDNTGIYAARHAELAKQLGYDEVPEHLPNPIHNDGSALEMSEESLAALHELRRYSDMEYATDSKLLASMGKGPKEYDPGHVIMPTRFGKETVYITDVSGKAIDFVLGDSIEAATAAANARIKANPNRSTLGIVNSTNVEQYKILRDQTWTNNVINVGDSLAKGSRKVAGNRTGLIIDTKYLSAMIDEIGTSFRRQGKRYLASEFNSELAHLNYMQQVANVNTVGFRNSNSFDDVYSAYSSQLTGAFEDATGSLFSTASDLAEQSINAGLDKINSLLAPAVAKYGFRNAHVQTVAAKLAATNGGSPEQIAFDLISREHKGVSGDVGIKNIIKQSSAFTTFMALKLFETGHGLLTAASMMTTIPHTMSIFRTLKNETSEMKASRLGYLHDMLPNGMVVPNEVKMTLNTIHKWMKGDYAQVLSDASKAGYLDAPFSEFMKSMGEAHVGKAGTWFNKILDKSGIISQKSEEMARQISFLTAYDMIKNAGRNGHEISMAAANDVANRIIGDYRPTQKSSVFRGTVGTPLSLFQTFSTNYYQKLFQSIENKEHRSLMVRYATQAFVFGGTSVPGYDVFNQNMFNNYDGTRTPEESIRSIKNKDLADVLLYGTLSNLPKVLGQDGIALTSRGAMQMPKMLTNPLDLMSAPAPSMIGGAINTLSTGLQALAETGTLGTRQMQESIILAMPNRPLRGLMEVAQGYSVNHSHNLVNDHTRDTLSIIARAAGLKPLQEAEQAKAMAIDRTSVLQQQQRRGRLSDAVQAAMRNNEFNGTSVNKALQEYVATGGDLNQANQWLSGLAKKSTTEVFQARMLKALKHNPNSAETLRFLNFNNNSNFEEN
jgi:hypothetical protein